MEKRKKTEHFQSASLTFIYTSQVNATQDVSPFHSYFGCCRSNIVPKSLSDVPTPNYVAKSKSKITTILNSSWNGLQLPPNSCRLPNLVVRVLNIVTNIETSFIFNFLLIAIPSWEYKIPVFHRNPICFFLCFSRL